MKVVLNLFAFAIAMTIGTLAAYAVFTLPQWAFGAEPRDMILWGWITGAAAFVVMGLLTIGVFAALRKIFIP